MSAQSVTIKDFSKELPGKVSSDDPTSYVFPEIVSVGKTGKNLFWQIVVKVKDKEQSEQQNKDVFIDIKDEYFDSTPMRPELQGWYKVNSKIGETGKVKVSSCTIVVEGKNLGKKNQTNVFTQALRDALSKYNKQKQKGQVSEENNTDDNQNACTAVPPMLAYGYTDYEHKVNFPAFVQRKYNGVRVVSCASYDDSGKVKEINMYSRTRKPFHVFDYIKESLVAVFEYWKKNHGINLYLDGEVYKHEMDLQTISGLSRRKELKHDSERLYYNIYDCFVFDKSSPREDPTPFKERLLRLETSKSILSGKYAEIADTFPVSCKEEIDNYYKKFLEEKYEGAMVRNSNAVYLYSYNSARSFDLLKLKPTMDAEYEVVDYKQGTQGKSKGDLIFIVKTTAGKTFNVNIAVTLEKRKELFNLMSQIEENGKTHFENKYKGKLMIVYFDELSTGGIPVRARTEGVLRDYE